MKHEASLPPPPPERDEGAAVMRFDAFRERWQHLMAAAGSVRPEDEAPPAPRPSSAPPVHGEKTVSADDDDVDTSSTHAVQKQHSLLQQQSYVSSKTFDISGLLEEVDHDGSAILLRRPDRISLSYYMPTVPRRDDAVAFSMLLSGLQFPLQPR
mmetsp:Transcript_20105/g.43649  ORF Transcript_20105/g.43649 Transcript_20105/m.43649 type:complete len:154 (+) Transcript_20105:124-585(+)